MKVHLEKEIENLKQLLTTLGTNVEQTLEEAVRSVENRDPDTAIRVMEGDTRIDSAEVHIEEECLKILALYQPVAGDLRYVITLLKVNAELERIGDLAANIAGRAVDIASLPHADLPLDFATMFMEVRSMLKRSLDALICRNSLTAIEVINHDDTVDNLHRQNYIKMRALIQENPAMVSYYLDLITVSRSLERIADGATNICEDVIYLEQGRIVRHIHEYAPAVPAAVEKKDLFGDEK